MMKGGGGWRVRNERTVNAGADATTTAVGQVCDAELLPALTGHVGAALAAFQPALGEVLVGTVKGDRVAVGGHQVADDELRRTFG